MVERNEHNAIIQHGTMTIVRKDALEEVGGWSEWCITEDTELGLKLFEAGYSAAYIPQSMGKGLMPDTLQAFMSQRYRWVYGAMQIMKRHAGAMFFGRTKLYLGAALSLPVRLAAVDFRRPRPDRDAVRADLDIADDGGAALFRRADGGAVGCGSGAVRRQDRQDAAALSAESAFRTVRRGDRVHRRAFR